MSDKPTCPHCGRIFAAANDLRNHHAAKHRTREEARAERKKKKQAEEDPSMADELLEAIENRYAGVEPPEYLANMFPDELRGPLPGMEAAHDR